MLRVGNKQDQFPTQTGEVTTPLTQFTQNIMGTSVITVKPKAKTTQTKTSTQQMPIQPDFYLQKTKEQVGLEKQNKVAIEKEPEQQVEGEQWEFIRYEVEKMKEAREIAQKEQQELKIEQQKIREQKAKLEAEEEQRLQAQCEKTQNSILQAKRGLEELQDKLASVSKMTQQEEGRQLTESIELSGPLNQRIKEVLKIKDEAPSLISYPSSESLQEFKSDEIDFEQYWYYAVKAEWIKQKMDQATRAFHERDEYYKDPKLYDSLYAEYVKQVEGLQHQLKVVSKILSEQKTDTGMYEYPSSPSLVLHLGELDDKPKEYFEKTKKEVSCKNTLAK